jgi:hypothetical protein
MGNYVPEAVDFPIEWFTEPYTPHEPAVTRFDAVPIPSETPSENPPRSCGLGLYLNILEADAYNSVRL